ncbi:ATP-binding protein [Cryobacterium zongtaii]|uniref:ATP-binding protein n=1 Tax=Cryobacterium zongtaii TaxID=1259217 RepID=A0A2S3ZKY0_9MICO|nr:ATP-binding protein [Cryobacterium zongtaii]POH68419.1 ATP-binding protein [Cryobacterium zongtaii]
MILETLPDIPRGYTGLAEWAACLVYILILRKRMPVVPLVLALAGGEAGLYGIQVFAGTLPIEFWTLGMILAVAGMYALLYGSAQLSARDAGYFTVRALVLAELVASLQWQLESYFLPPTADIDMLWHVLAILGVYGAAFTAAYFLEARHFPKDRPLNATTKELISAVAIALATFIMSNMSFVNANTPFSGRLSLEIFYIRTLVNLCGYAALYAQQEQRLEAQGKTELDAMNGILRSQHDQTLLSKRNIDMVNRKYHDMKHQIGIIRAESNPEKKAAYLDELEGAIKGYEAQNKTGNGVLDTILTAKSMYCAEHDITLTAVADGTVLDDLDAMDISTIFGNALDNAIESTMTLADPDRRLIRLALYAQNDLVLIRVENYFEGELRFENGALVTRKADRDDHGYGLRNIRHTAERYGGSATVHAEDNWFVLRVLIPKLS